MYDYKQIKKINAECSNGFTYNCVDRRARQLDKIVKVNENVQLKVILENSHVKEGDSWVMRPTLIVFKEEITGIDDYGFNNYELTLVAEVPEDYTIKKYSMNTLKKLSRKYTDDSILELAGYKKVKKLSKKC